MTGSFRRIVTGHDAAGLGVFISNEAPTPKLIDSGDAAFEMVWATPNVPADLNAGTDGPVAAGKRCIVGR